MYKGIDCASKLTESKAQKLKAAGYDFAGRYLVPDKGALEWKALKEDEAKRVTAAGLRLLTVYETTADRAKGGAMNGAYDGRQAYLCAIKINMPHDGVIYFAVDFDMNDFDTLEAYLRAARTQTGPYEIGVYGSYKIIEEMHKRNACKCYWQCVAWSYGKVSSHNDVYQHTAQVSLAGVGVDLNNCPDMDKAGIWTYEEYEEMNIEKMLEEMTPEQAQRIVEKANQYNATLPPSKYAVEACKKGVKSGLFSDGNRDDLIDNPQAYMKRQELATVLDRRGLLDD
jgi:hypothetical protein